MRTEMSEPKFTPGPWKVESAFPFVAFGHDWTIIRKHDTPDDRWVAVACIDNMHGDCTHETITTPDEQRANASLIAAAPALFEACETALELWPVTDEFKPRSSEERAMKACLLKLKAALALASGEANV
jgi:hypothetical protein